MWPSLHKYVLGYVSMFSNKLMGYKIWIYSEYWWAAAMVSFFPFVGLNI
jgi:hypothetical protein